MRQAKPGSTGEEVADATLKVEIGAQWVKVVGRHYALGLQDQALGASADLRRGMP